MLNYFKNLMPKVHQLSWWLGIMLVGIIAFVSGEISQIDFFQHYGLSVMTLAIIIGIVLGNSIFPFFAVHTESGVDYAKNILLRAGIIIYGFRITFQQIVGIGWTGIIIDGLIVSLTFLLAVQLGKRVFKLDQQTSILIGAGSAICGAAAVMATEPVVRAPAYKVAIAVATVVVFGTVSMFLYPVLNGFLHLSDQAYGVYVGSTIHEVAQVVAASKDVGEGAAESAVIVKMIRVMMLVPFLILLSIVLAKTTQQSSSETTQKLKITIPWFAVLFIVASVVNSFNIIPEAWLPVLNQISTFLLAMAMAALGLRTHVGAIKQAGLKPMLLAGILFIFLVVVGYGINVGVTYCLS